ncbi:MAG: hypothetical protein KZQ64_00660 [gamma proteobacterium symbiont of Bathyaustriella thionipta]|nr:hypothetical protein [gamma proteobacterium symbiont of Bathyaustriella thionipta]MCU7966982.1 hypothetical protein [gamma proteobacterium symbiont of Bathyaustriella thionipta]
MNQHTETVKQLIHIARHLHKTGRSGASTGEQIAATFILNKPEYLPDNYRDMVEAWERGCRITPIFNTFSINPQYRIHK